MAMADTMAMGFILISAAFAFLSFSEVTDFTDVRPGEFTSNPQSSTYFSCGGPRTGLLPGQPRTATAWQDDLSNTSLFYIELQKRIEQRAQQNLDLASHLASCYRVPRIETATADCESTRNWVNPRQFLPTSGSGTPYEESLVYAIKEARIHLSLVTNTGSGNPTSPNSTLSPRGFKSVDWSPLTPVELQESERILRLYAERFRQTLQINETEYNSILQPYDRSQNGEVWPNPMLVQDGEMRHRMLLSNLQGFMETRAQRHLDRYRQIVSQYPIINYLSSMEPSPSEIVQAAQRLKANAENELRDLQQMGRRINSMSPNVPNEASQLLDYNLMVEELLAERPEFCRIATNEQNRRSRRAITQSLLLGAPLLAASFLAPPVAAMALAAAGGTVFAYQSYGDFVSQQSSAYAAVINDGSLRASQYSVDEVRGFFRTDLAMIPLAVASSGGLSLLSQGIGRARQGLSLPRHLLRRTN
jgi:hypothetical protein